MKRTIFTILAFVTLYPCKSQTKMNLDQCMSYAVDHSYKSSRSSTEASNSGIAYTTAILSHLPSLSGSVGAGSNFGRGIDPATNSYINTSTFNNSISANASLPVFNGLRLLNQSRSARIAKLRGEETLRQTRDKVAEETMAAYAEVVYNTELLSLHQRRIENYQKEEQLKLRMCELGSGAETDLAQIRATLASEEYIAISARNRLEISIIKLKDCMNFPLTDSLDIDATIPATELFRPEQTPDQIYSYASVFHPSAIIGKQNLQTSKLSLAMARGNYYPSIGLYAGISTSYYTRLDNASTSSYDPYGTQLKNNIGEGISVSMSVPIFNALNRRLSVSQAKNNHTQAQRDYQEAMRGLSSEIRQAVMELDASHSQWLQAQRNVAFQKIANDANRRKYTEGVLGIIELQTSDNQLLQAEIELRNSYLRYQIKLREVNYYKGIPYIQ